MSPTLELEHFAPAGADEDLFGLIFAAIRKVRLIKRQGISVTVAYTPANGKVNYRLPHKFTDWHHQKVVFSIIWREEK